MLLDYYYSIQNQQTAGNVARFDVLLLPECSVYKGHFPDMPVAPGVCNIQMIKECAERITGKQLLLDYIAQCKFMALISPQQLRELQVKIELAENVGERIHVVASVEQDGKELMVFKGEFVVSCQIPQ
jgi:3-hydroxyacyl-[acyl-carrier-protein] dehydratase